MKKIPKKYQHLFDIEYIEDHTDNIGKLSIGLKKSKYAGISIYAKKNIKKGAIIAYYKMKVFDEDYDSPFGTMYNFTVYNKREEAIDELVGDLYEGSLEQPYRGKPFWGYFANEPSKDSDEQENCEIDINTKRNFRDRKTVKKGDTIIYSLKATSNIKKGENIVWCYGEFYDRNYKTACNYSTDD
jgi:hypothetical protein